MARGLPSGLVMRTLILLLSLVCAWPMPARAQAPEPADGARIQAAELLGIPAGQLSPGLQRDIDALAGKPLARPEITQLAHRIEEERPEVVVAVRIDPRDDGDARVFFLVARISDDAGLGSNINARYTVESVEIEGLDEHEISAGLRDRLQALVGTRLDPAEADRLIEDLKAERPGYDVSRRIERGTRRGQIRVVFAFTETEGLRWIPFAKSRSKYVYHSEEGWSGLQDIPMGSRDHRVTLGLALDDNDTLVEEYSGVRVRFESRRLGTERVAARLEASWLNNTWRAPVLAALDANPSIPMPYRRRITVEPALTVALTRHVRVSGGLSLSSLEALQHSPDSQMASTFTGAVNFNQRWNESHRTSQTVEAGYEVRTSLEGFGSDFGYTRHLARARYEFGNGRTHSGVIAEVFAGGITGDAPLFERFTLGDSATLRGWNKFDIAPAGGTRVFHQSVEYRLHGAALFLDAGSVWDDAGTRSLRSSTGFGFHTDNSFITVAFPLNAPTTRATLLIGVRF
jgi:hypothetical protein